MPNNADGGSLGQGPLLVETGGISEDHERVLSGGVGRAVVDFTLYLRQALE